SVRLLTTRPPPGSTLFPYTTLFRSTEAQKPLAVLDYQLNELMNVLEKGVKDREKLTEPRWRASFDLSVGRVLAMRARSLGYNQRSEEHTSELQSRENLVCRLLLEKK